MERESPHQIGERLRQTQREEFKKKIEEKKKGALLKTADRPPGLKLVVVDTSNNHEAIEEEPATPPISPAPPDSIESPPDEQPKPLEVRKEPEKVIPEMVVDIAEEERRAAEVEHAPVPAPPPLTEEQARALEEEERKKRTELGTKAGQGDRDGLHLAVDDPERNIDLKVISVDEIVKSYAFQKAEQKIRELLYASEEGMASGGRIKSVLNNIWGFFRHPVTTGKRTWLRAAEDAYLYKFYREAIQEIESNQNLLLELQAGYRIKKPAHTNDPDRKRELNYEILERVIKEYQNNAIEQEERGNEISDPRVNAAFQDLLSRYYINGWDRKRFETEQRNMINELKEQGLIKNADFLRTSGRKTQEVDQGLMYATNLFQIAEDYKVHIDAKLREMGAENNLTPEQKTLLKEHVRSMINLDISLGAKLSDIHNKRPAADAFRRTEGWIAAMQRFPILGRIASNPGSWAFAGGLIGNVGVKLAGRATTAAAIGGLGLASGAWIPVISAGAMAGLYAWRRRSVEVKKDRAMHQREKLLGKKFDNFRRTNMDQYEYGDVMKTTAELQAELEEIRAAGAYDSLTQKQKERLANMLALFKEELHRDKQYRISGGENKTVDLIKVEEEEGEKYQTTLMSKTDLKIALYRYLHDNNLLEGDDHRLSSNAEFKTLFDSRYLEVENHINKVDKKFESHQRKSALAVGGLALVGGCAGAVTGQWAVNRIREGLEWGGSYTAWDSIADKWREYWGTGNLKSEATVSEFVFGGKKLSPGTHTFFTPENEQFKLFVNNEGSLDYVKTRQHLPEGWRLDGGQLVHEIPDTSHVQRFNNWDDFAKTLDPNYTGQKVVYGDPFYQGTAPKKGIRAIPEFFQNLIHNKQLNANLTELMMEYKPGDNKGEVIVDASKMFGKMLKKSMDESGVDLQDLLGRGENIYLNLALDNEINGGDGTQFKPIMLPMGADGKVRVPKEIAKIFFGFDSQGNLLQGPGNHPGLHQLVLVTDETRGDARVMRQIAATLGGKPEMDTAVVSEGKTDTWSFTTNKKLKEYDNTPVAAAFSGASRWPLEYPLGKNDRRKRESEETPPGELISINREGERMTPGEEKEKANEEKQGKIKGRIGRIRESIRRKKNELPAQEINLEKENDEPKKINNPDRSGEFSMSGMQANTIFENHKSLFLDSENLERILGDRSFRTMLNKMEELKEKEQANGQVSNSERNKIVKAHNRFKKLAVEKGDKEAAEMSFPEFIFCLRQGLSGYKELVQQRKEKRNEARRNRREVKKAKK